MEEQQQQQNMPDDSTESVAVTGIGKSTNDDDLKSPHPLDASVREIIFLLIEVLKSFIISFVLFMYCKVQLINISFLDMTNLH